MNSTLPDLEVEPALSAASAAAPRLDLYQPIHKALRAFMGDTQLRLGALDVADASELQQTLAQADSLLDLVARHLMHEDRFVHPALESAAPGSCSGTAREHEEHRAGIQALQAEVAALREAPDDGLALRLYRHFALFVAENLSHMHFEETVLNATLWAHFSDADLQALHARLLASIGQDELALTLRWMMPAMTPRQRLGFIRALQHEAPPEAVRAVLDAVQAVLSPAAWAKLARGLCLPVVPGLVTG